MKIRRALRSGLVVLALSAGGLPAFADSEIKVSLWDKGGEMGMGMGMGMKADMMMAMMGIDIDQTSVPAGKVTFEVTNISKEMLHEMLVAPIASADVILPYNVDEDRVEEELSGDLGEVSELAPGESGALTLDLKPGLYVLYCNVAGHFMAGMWITIEVTP